MIKFYLFFNYLSKTVYLDPPHPHAHTQTPLLAQMQYLLASAEYTAQFNILNILNFFSVSLITFIF